jgi:ribosomal protein S18 acetylase RimI-like enzyme
MSDAAVDVQPLRPGHAAACDAIVAGLPYHFGLEEGRRACAEAVRTHEGLVALSAGRVVGFLTYQRRFVAAAEITWMAVDAARRRTGVGRRLVERLSSVLAREGRRFLVLLTVSPSDTSAEPPDGYQATRAFYESVGFVYLRNLPGLWTSDLPVLMVKVLESRRPPPDGSRPRS